MNDETRHPVDLLAEEYAARLRSGETVEIEEYVARYPEQAQLIRSIFPSIKMVEQVSQRSEQDQRTWSAQSERQPLLRPLESLGDFQIVREIGRGGMGVVYEAVQRSLKRRVALKVVSALVAGSETQRERFRREAESAAGLHHTNIVPVFGIGEDHGLQYYAMQLIDGVPLSDVIDQLRLGAMAGPGAKTIEMRAVAQTIPNGAPTGTSSGWQSFNALEAANLLMRRPASSANPTVSPLASAASIVAETVSISAFFDQQESTVVDQASHGKSKRFGVRDAKSPSASAGLGLEYYRAITALVARVANALQHAHHQGVMHRDIKPSNLLLDREGTVWVSDFGLARKEDFDGITQTGEIVGTLRYMAPEQLRGKFDARSDVYSLGVTLYELLTLRPANESPQHRLSSAGKGDRVASPRSICKDIPVDLETIVMKASSWEPAHRYGTAAEFEHDLTCFLEDRPIAARPISAPERLWRWSRRNPAIAGLSAAIVSLLVAIAGMLGWGYREKQLAFNAIDKLYAQTQSSLREKSAALDNVERERQRAEINLNLAVEAFGEIIDNIASRGSADAMLEDFEEDSQLLGDTSAALSSADVHLLTRTMAFFERFSQENDKDLSAELAQARMRMGDIQLQLGKLDDAQQSYRRALEALTILSAKNPENIDSILHQASILNNLTLICARRGDVLQAFAKHEQALDLLNSNTKLQVSKEGRFAIAKTHNCLASLGARFGIESPARPRRPFARFLPFPERPPLKMSPMATARIKRQEESNKQAMALLVSLVDEDPQHAGYQATLARAYRDNVRISQFNQNAKKADESLRAAVKILEALVSQHGTVATFKFHLADTLCTPLHSGADDLMRFSKALGFCDDLIAEQPNVPEYRALRATALVRMAEYYFSFGRPNQAEQAVQVMRDALAIQRELAKQFSDVLLYQFSLVISLQRMADMHLTRKEPDAALLAIDEALQVVDGYKGHERLRVLLGPQMGRLLDRRKAIQDRQTNK